MYKSKSSFIIDAFEKYIKSITPDMLLGVHEDRNYIIRDGIDELTKAIKIELREELTKSISKDVTENMCSEFVAAFIEKATNEDGNESKMLELNYFLVGV